MGLHRVKSVCTFWCLKCKTDECEYKSHREFWVVAHKEIWLHDVYERVENAET